MDITIESGLSPPDYPVIFHANNPELMEKVIELSTILDYWGLYENNNDDPVPNTVLQTAVCGSSFGGASPKLTIRQLFSVWKSGKLVHASYYGEDGTEIHEKLYMVGFGVGLSGAYVFWGIVPSQKTIVISDHSPVPHACSIGSGMQIYRNASKNEGVSG
jgi:hypothetical protein